MKSTSSESPLGNLLPKIALKDDEVIDDYNAIGSNEEAQNLISESSVINEELDMKEDQDFDR